MIVGRAEANGGGVSNGNDSNVDVARKENPDQSIARLSRTRRSGSVSAERDEK